MSLILVHRTKDQPGALPFSPSLWATCLREIAFLDDHLSPAHIDAVKGDGTVLSEGRALVFLLQVLCGLKSPVLGETEVMGQFKAHLQNAGDEHPLKRDPSLLPFIFNATKEARTKFLSATGSLTYGQIVRRWLKDSPTVVLWGFGSLGKEIYPWMREKTTAVVVRSLRDEGDVPLVVESARAAAHVVAAPLGDAAVEALRDGALVIDLRDRPLASAADVRNLGDLFREIRDLRREREEVVPRCEAFLEQRVREYLSRRQIRPFGWEDLCG